jgi:hypothetical protein
MLRATMMLFKYAFRPDYQQKLNEIFSLLQELMGQETGLKCLETVIRYVFATLEGAEVNTLKQIVDESLSVEKGEFVMTTIAESLFNKGVQQGIQTGILQGKLEGLYIAIELGLEIKYGKQSLDMMEGIRKITDLDRLMAIRDAIRMNTNMKDIRDLIQAYRA